MFLLDVVSHPCDSVGLLKVIFFVKSLLNYVFFVIPLLIIGILSFDMFRNVTSNSEDNQKKRMNIFLRRIISLVIVFLIPTIVSFVVNFFDEDGNTNYLKCLSVTSERIEFLSKNEEENCIDNYKWDPVNKICLFVGEKTSLPDNFSVIERRQKLDVVTNKVNSLNREFKGSNSPTMMEYRQSDSKWGGKSFCGSSDTMSGSGCGPTSLAMIITGYGNDPKATPLTVRDYLCSTGLHHSDGMSQWSEPLNENFLSHFGLEGELMFSINKGSSEYSEEKAKQLKDAVDQGYAVLLLIPLHYVAIDKGGCPADKVYYYNPAEADNGCVTMKELWNKTWNRKDRCTVKHHSCGWRWAWKYKPASGTV